LALPPSVSTRRPSSCWHDKRQDHTQNGKGSLVRLQCFIDAVSQPRAIRDQDRSGNSSSYRGFSSEGPPRGLKACFAEGHAATIALTSITMSGFIKPVRNGGLIAKRWPVVGGVLLVAAVGGLLLWSPWEPRELMYEGHPITWWLRHGYGYRYVYQGRSASMFILPRSLVEDPKAVRTLTKAARRDSWIGAAVYRKHVWPRLPSAIRKHVPPPSPGNPLLRRQAVELLGYIGPIAKPAIPSLLRALTEEDDASIRLGVVRALGEVGRGESAVAAGLRGASMDSDQLVRATASEILRRGEREKAVVAGDRERGLAGPAREEYSYNLGVWLEAMKQLDPNLSMGTSNYVVVGTETTRL
jgi:hypothetical protein